MRYPKGRLMTIGVLAAVMSTTVACNSQTSENQGPVATSECPDASTTGKVVLSVSAPIEGFAPLLLAMETGAIADAGLEVSIEPLSSADSLAAVGQGKIDGQLTSYGAGHMNAAAAGVDLKWVMPFYELPEYGPESALPGYWARTDVVGTGAQPDLAGLKGETIGSPTSGTGAGGMIMAKALNASGMKISDVNFTQLSGADALAALENGSVAAAWLSQPFDQAAAKNDKLRLIATYPPGINGSGLVVGRGLLDRPQVLIKLLSVIGEVSEKYLQGNYRTNEETTRMIAKALDVDQTMMTTGTPLVFDPTLSMDEAAAYVDELQSYLLEQGDLEYKEKLPADKLISTEFVDKAAQCRAGN